jgi:FKBP-type peptidyl-prolyl cis-trans isomerase FklB
MVTALTACNNGGGNVTNLNNDKEKESYAIGMSIGRSLKQQEADVDPKFIAAGINEMLKETPQPLLNDEQLRETMMGMQKKFMEKQQAAMAARSGNADENLAKSKAFLEENAKKEGVKTTDSGLQYKVIEAGKGTSPKATDVVSVHYKGTLPDGKEFDSSYKRGQPAEFPVNGVIPGWTEALQLMKPGAKYQLFIPPDLAYGAQGAGQDIGPNQALVFEVELLEVKKQ